MSRDFVGDLAETVALIWPKPDGAPAELDDGSLSVSGAIARLEAAPRVARAGHARGDARSSRCLRAAMRCSSWRPARSGRRLGAARQDRAGAGVRARRRCGRGVVARPRAALCRRCSTGREGRGDRPVARDVPVFRPFMLAHPLEEATRRPRRLCRRMEMGRDPRPARPCRRRDPALQPRGRRHHRELSRRGRRADRARRARRRTDGAGRGAGRCCAWRRRGELQRAPAAARAQGWCRRRCWPTIPPSSASTTSCSTVPRMSAPCRGPSAAPGWRPSSPGCHRGSLRSVGA